MPYRKNSDEARSAVNTGRMRYVLAFSLVGVVIALTVAWLLVA